LTFLPVKFKILPESEAGESKLVNNCKDGVRCSEDQHQLNRRSTFIVVK
jgi:hypothetical protein